MIVGKDAAGLRLDQALAKLVTGLSRAEAKTLIENKGVRVSGRVERSKSIKVAEGTSLEIDAAVLDDRPAELVSSLEALSSLVTLAAVGPGFAVAEKPEGLPCTPYCFGDTRHLGTAVRTLLRGRMSEPPPPEDGLVHRLDVGTQGLCLFALDAVAYETFVEARVRGEIERTYHAWVDGHIADSGKIDRPIAHHATKDDRMLVLPAESYRGLPQEAETRWKVLARESRASLVEVHIRGGRRHQIRVHLASLGHPLRGDRLYGSTTGDRFFLLAHALRFVDVTGALQRLETNASGRSNNI